MKTTKDKLVLRYAKLAANVLPSEAQRAELNQIEDQLHLSAESILAQARNLPLPSRRTLSPEAKARMKRFAEAFEKTRSDIKKKRDQQ